MAGSIARKALHEPRSKRRCGSSPPKASMPMIRPISPQARPAPPIPSEPGHEMRGIYSHLHALVGGGLCGIRSEERRVGKECGSRWAADREKKKMMM